ncbi:hypothetical protein [Campylobacter sp. MG1]|uniref:hypothetical protein n=1 Tax=Campylobacter sp. MG1 TaxID=2976332 RepID=UPI00226D3E38|nr:hypothetical protein [Campylobacter sp. MG1]
MYKLSRVFLHNLGINGGLYFDDFELDFYDESNKVSHFLIDTENGGGKTTIISLIHTALLPDKAYFIQSLRPNSKIKLDDYVQDELGFIMLELEKEKNTDIFNNKEKLIIMQSLIKNSNDLIRHYYTFIPESFSYDECKELLKNLKDLKKLKEKLNENTANFAFITDSNSKHIDYLCQNYGFDKDILKLYAKFNSEEGGISNFFNFNTIKEFLSKLFFLLSNNTASNDLLKEIKDHKDSINQKPELEKKLIFYKDFLKIIDDLVLEDSKKQEKIKQKDKILSTLFNVKDSLEIKQENLNTHKQDLEKQNKELENNIILLKNKICENEKYKDFYTYKKVEIDIKNLEQENKVKQGWILDNEIKIHTIKTLKEQKIYDELKTTHKEKEGLLNKENQDLKPFTNSLNNAKNKLSDRLGYEIKQLENLINEDKNKKKETVEKTSILDKTKSENDKQIGGLNSEIKSLSDKISNFELKKQRLFDDLILKNNESLKECKERLEREYQENTTQKIAKENELKYTQSKIKEKIQEINNLESDKKIKEKEKQDYQEQINQALKLQEDIKTNEILKVLVDYNDDFIIDNDLLNKLNETIKQTEDKLTEQNYKTKFLDEKIAILQDTKTPLISESTKRALDLLREEIGGVGYYIHYLNTTEKSKLKEKLCKNPSIYSGLYANNKEDIIKAKEILKKHNFNDIVFINEINANDEQRASFYINDDEKYYDIDNYEETLINLQDDLSGAKNIKNTLENKLKVMEKAKDLLKLFLESFGSGKLEKLQNDLKNVDDEINKNDEKIFHLNQELENLNITFKDLENNINNLQDLINKFFVKNERVKSLLEIDFTELQKDLENSKNKLFDKEKENEKINVDKKDLENYKNKLEENIRQNENKITAYKNKYDHISINENYTSLELSKRSVEELEAEFKKCKKNYDDFVKDKNLDSLRYEINELENSLNAKRQLLDNLKQNPNFKEDILKDFINAFDLDIKIVEFSELNDKNKEKINKNLGEIGQLLKQKEILEKQYYLTRLSYDESLDINELIENNDKQLKENKQELGILENSLQILANNLSQAKDEYDSYRAVFKEFDAYLKNYSDYQYDKNDVEFKIGFKEFLDESVLSLNNLEKDIKVFEKQIENKHSEYSYLMSKTQLKELANYNNLKVNELLVKQEEIDRNIKITNAELDTIKIKLEGLLSRLKEYIEKICNTLHRFELSSKLDDSLEQIGGKYFLKIKKFDKKQISEKDVDILFEKIKNDDSFTRNKDGYDNFSANLIVELNPHIGIEVIKIDDKGNYYMSVDEQKSSGGEALTMAFILYLVIIKLKYAGSDKNMSFLILDNPIGKANKMSLLQAQIKMADKLGYQLIYTTPIADKNSQITFLNRISLMFNKEDTNTGRKYLTTIKGVIKNEIKAD